MLLLYSTLRDSPCHLHLGQTHTKSGRQARTRESRANDITRVIIVIAQPRLAGYCPKRAKQTQTVGATGHVFYSLRSLNLGRQMGPVPLSAAYRSHCSFLYPLRQLSPPPKARYQMGRPLLYSCAMCHHGAHRNQLYLCCTGRLPTSS